MQSYDDRVVLVGFTDSPDPMKPDNDFGTARVNFDLTPDMTFNGLGHSAFGFPGDENDVAFGVAVQADKKIVSVGTTLPGSIGDFALTRVRGTDGAADNADFGTLGRQTTDFGGSDQAQAVAIQPDQKIVVAGFSGTPGAFNDDFAVARYRTNGSLDQTGGFGVDGKLTTDFAGGSDFGYAVALQTDGKILVAGQSGNDFAVARYNTDGSPDRGFSDDGKQTTDFGPNAFATGVAVQADGKIVLGGTAFSSGSTNDFALARYNADGSPDSSFSGDGKQTAPIGAGTANDTATGTADPARRPDRPRAATPSRRGEHRRFRRRPIRR